MRFIVLIFLAFFLLNVALGQGKKPRILGQKELSTNQAQPITILLTDLYVEENGDDSDDDAEDDRDGDEDKDKDKDKDRGGNDRNAAYPKCYALEVFDGEDYSTSGTTVTPDPAFTGILTVEVRVRNDRHASKKFDLKIAVKPVNQPPQNKAPVITGQLPLTTQQNTSLKVTLADLIVSDPDDQYPGDFSLKVASGENYTVNETTINPKTGFTGILNVPVQVNDGEKNSEPFNLKISVVEAANIAPIITGQSALSTPINKPINVLLSHLQVIDPDNNYPADFTLKILAGENYSLDGATVKPKIDFAGDLFVKVSVHDGIAASEVYDLKISVMSAANTAPVITGQSGIKITEGQTLEIKFSHLVIEDPDSRYPEDFTLEVLEGDQYTVADNSITPVQGFLGTLSVRISVNDGKVSSKPFDLKVQVVAKDRLEITGQKTLEIPEDSSIVIHLSDLAVNDPGNTYPGGFTLQILKGENYDAVNGTVKPHRDFYGNLSVSVAITRDGTTSPPFSLLVVVTPVNDPPLLLNLETDPLVATGSGPWPVTSASEVGDVDDDHLFFAEVGFDRANYRRGTDHLLFENTENIHGVFDTETGILFLLGRAPLEEYQMLIRTLRYDNKNSADSLQLAGSKNIYLQLNDGKDTSPVYERALMFDGNIYLEIPTAFTPNNDHANDTWRVTALQQVEQISTFIRVYDRRGNMVFETAGLENEWDGHFNGTPLPADVYFYTIEMDLSYRKVNYKGIISILR